MITAELAAQYEHILPTYARFDTAFVRGEGSRLYDEAGKEYIDFASGIGVNSVGYANPVWTAAVANQAATLAHVSNLYYTKPAAELAVKLAKLTGLKQSFFSNSGAEANEGLIKLARKYSYDKYGEGRSRVVTLVQSFHGRTISTLAATGQDVFHNHFMPFTEGFSHVPAGDIEPLKALEGQDVCAVMIELVQGEGGVLPQSAEYVQAVAALCEKNDWLFLADEVQTGVGRTGTWFAFQDCGVTPDAVSFAKGIASGLPLGGFMVGEKALNVLTAGTHATTFGGNPICCAAALATLEILAEAVPEVEKKGQYIREKLAAMNLSKLKLVRGKGLMLGLVVEGAPRDYVAAGLEQGLVALTAGKDAVRLLPPLTISYEEIDKGLAILGGLLK